jgi:hypothetical protein
VGGAVGQRPTWRREVGSIVVVAASSRRRSSFINIKRRVAKKPFLPAGVDKNRHKDPFRFNNEWPERVEGADYPPPPLSGWSHHHPDDDHRTDRGWGQQFESRFVVATGQNVPESDARLLLRAGRPPAWWWLFILADHRQGPFFPVQDGAAMPRAVSNEGHDAHGQKLLVPIRRTNEIRVWSVVVVEFEIEIDTFEIDMNNVNSAAFALREMRYYKTCCVYWSPQLMVMKHGPRSIAGPSSSCSCGCPTASGSFSRRRARMMIMIMIIMMLPPPIPSFHTAYSKTSRWNS